MLKVRRLFLNTNKTPFPKKQTMKDLIKKDAVLIEYYTIVDRIIQTDSESDNESVFKNTDHVPYIRELNLEIALNYTKS